MTRISIGASLLGLSLATPSEARVVVFHERGFPAVESEAPARETLAEALSGMDVVFVGLDELRAPGALEGADLLVLPYGSAFPADAWSAIRAHLERGGNLLNLGGRPLYVPVFEEVPKESAKAAKGEASTPEPSETENVEKVFRTGPPQASYWRLLAAVQAAEVPRRDLTRFAWDDAYPFKTTEVRARRVFWVNTLFTANYAPPAGSWRGLGFFLDKEGRRIAAPITRLDFTLTPPGRALQGHGRFVMLNFEPAPGYWESAPGRSLIREAAEHAERGGALVWVELPRISLLPGETAQAVLHVREDRHPRAGGAPRPGQVRVELKRSGKVLDTRTIPGLAEETAVNLGFPAATSPGLYEVRATYERDGGVVQVHETGFWRRDDALLSAGAPLTAGTTYLRQGGTPFIPMGVNAWVNDTVWPFFPENGNALEWERDFAEMEARGLNFVRTGIWFDRLRLVDTPTGTARESVLRNIEAMLHSAGRHRMHVQFTFFSFEPQTVFRGDNPVFGPGRNPYTDPVAVEAQKAFIRSIVSRFRDVPFLSFDLINEPSFSNPRAIFRGNQPNADPTEVAAWQDWLEKRYGTVRALVEAWSAVPDDIPSFGAAPLPAPADLGLTRNGNPRQVRALDYNLFAQEMFSRWAAELVQAIRDTGSRQLVAVGQDEGGVTNRVLNHFYGGSVDLTSLHNWWQDDALLWSAVAAKRPGVPNLLGETGAQPAVAMDGETRWDETKGLGLVERKLALGLAAGNAGSAIWIWSRNDPFRFGRPDGSATLWIDVLSGLGAFAKRAAPHLSDARPSEVAIVLGQSLQLSVFNEYAIEAQQKAVRALYHHARASAEAVGEYQLDLLGERRLILLPAPWALSQRAWDTLLEKVRGGATLLVTGRFDQDEHFRPTDRHRTLGLDYTPRILASRDNPIRWPGGSGRAVFSGNKTTYLEQAVLPDGATFARRVLGRGQVLFFSLPLELGDDLKLVGDVYRWALSEAGVAPVYRTTVDDPGILICPTTLETGTLYVLTSESSVRREVTFKDAASGTDVRAALDPGRAAVLLVMKNGEVAARYDPEVAP